MLTICSRCDATIDTSDTHMVPGWVEEWKSVMMSARCIDCCKSSLDVTYAAIVNINEDVRKAFVLFLDTHKRESLMAAVRDSSLEVARTILLEFLDEWAKSDPHWDDLHGRL
jgi:hypothetical protein